MSDVHIVPENLVVWLPPFQILSPPSSYNASLITEGKYLDAKMGLRIEGTGGRPGSFQVVIPPASSRIGGKTLVCPLPSRRESWYLVNQEHKVDPAADLSVRLSAKNRRNNSWLSLGPGPVTFL